MIARLPSAAQTNFQEDFTRIPLPVPVAKLARLDLKTVNATINGTTYRGYLKQKWHNHGGTSLDCGGVPESLERLVSDDARQSAGGGQVLRGGR